VPYCSVVDYTAFQGAVLELAGDGVRLTKAGVAERLSIDPAHARELLDRMARDGRLELDVDERSDEIFYTPSKRAGGLAALDDRGSAVEEAEGSAALVLGAGAATPARRKLAVGVVLGGLFPGLGLAYAAPWPIVAAASIVVVVGWKVLSLIPILSSLLVVPFLVVCAVASAILGGMYAWSFNQAGKRAPLGDEPVSPKALLQRARKK